MTTAERSEANVDGIIDLRSGKEILGFEGQPSWISFVGKWSCWFHIMTSNRKVLVVIWNWKDDKNPAGLILTSTRSQPSIWFQSLVTSNSLRLFNIVLTQSGLVGSYMISQGLFSNITDGCPIQKLIEPLHILWDFHLSVPDEVSYQSRLSIVVSSKIPLLYLFILKYPNIGIVLISPYIFIQTEFFRFTPKS